MSDIEGFRRAAVALALGGGEDARASAVRLGSGIRSVVLVEGVSDAVAVEALAARREVDLDRAAVCVVPMGGVTNFGKYLRVLGPDGLGIRIAGLCDAGEERYFRRSIDAATSSGTSVEQTEVTERRTGSALVAYFVCHDDLEDEFIHALGLERTQEVIAEQGDLPLFRTFQNQPAQRERPTAAQLRRFFGTTSGRKEKYAGALVAALDLTRVPRPLEDVLGFALAE